MRHIELRLNMSSASWEQCFVSAISSLRQDVTRPMELSPQSFCEKYRPVLLTLQQDESPSDDLLTGRLFEEEDWIKRLPMDALSFIYAVQVVGNHLDRPLHCSEIAAQVFTKWKKTMNTDDLEWALAMYIVAIKYTRPDDPLRVERLRSSALAYQAKWEQTENMNDLDIAIHFFRRAVVAAERNSQSLEACCTDLAYVLFHHWIQSKSPESRQEASCTYLRAIELATDDSLLPRALSNYGEFVRLTTSMGDASRFKYLAEAVETQDRAIKMLRPNLPLPYGNIWRNAAIANSTMFLLTADEKLSSNAIGYYKQSLAHTHKSDPLSSTWRIELAEHYFERYQAWGYIEDILAALGIYNEVIEHDMDNSDATIGKAGMLQLLSEREPDIAKSRSNLLEACRLADSSIEMSDKGSKSCGWAYYRTSVIYSHWHEMDGDIHHLHRAVDLSILSLNYPEHHAYWDFCRNCAEVCRARHVVNGSLDDLDQAFRAAEAAIEHLEGWQSTALASCSAVLGKCYMSRYNCNGKLDDLEETLRLLSAACIPPPDQQYTLDLAWAQNDVANALCAKFRETYSPKDLDSAIEHYALSIKNLDKARLPANHRDFAMLQTGIGLAMLQRYLHWGSQEDLTSAINSFRKSLSGTDAHNSQHAVRVCNLSYALELMFLLRTEMSFLKEAQSLLLAELAALRDHSSSVLQSIHSHLGIIYLNGYRSTDNPDDLDLAVSQFDKVLTFSGSDPRQRINATMCIALALHKKATNSGKLEDYTSSIEKYDEGANAGSINNLHWIMTRTYRANVFNEIFEKFDDVYYGRKALQEFSELAIMSAAPMQTVLQAAVKASVLEVSLESNYHAAYDQIQRAAEIFPRAVLFHSNRLELLRVVRDYHFLPSTATALAIEAGRPAAEILTSLEQTRAFLWNRYLYADVPLDDLRLRHPDLANEFELLRSLVVADNISDANGITAGVLPPKDQLRLEKHVTTDKYADLLRRIRTERGFEDFLLPTFGRANLLPSSPDVPAVYLNISLYRCDAILRTSDGVRILALPELEVDEVIRQSAQLKQAQRLLGKEDQSACTMFEKVMLWMWETTARPILESLEQDFAMQTSGERPRIYWVSSGWLSFFPIHAAGDWTPSRNSETRPSVHERVISSYIPSLSILDFLRRRADALGVDDDVQSAAILVGMPQTANMEDSDLNAETEVALIQAITEADTPTQTLLSRGFNEVTSALRTCRMAHFACHGCADREDPSKSALRLADWIDKPLNVRALLKMKLANCQLAFLSACETATNKDVRLRDEGLHVASAFSMAGVPHTVAGMWKIKDSASVELVSAFYKELFAVKGKLRYRGTAAALYAAVEHLRNQGFHPLYWGTFICMGP